MTYIIYKDGEEFNRIVADEAFCKQFYSEDGYSYEEVPPMPVTTDEEPPPEPTIEDLQAELTATRKKLDAAIRSNAVLEECMVEMAEVVYA